MGRQCQLVTFGCSRSAPKMSRWSIGMRERPPWPLTTFSPARPKVKSPEAVVHEPLRVQPTCARLIEPRLTDCAPTVQFRPRRAMTSSGTTGLVKPEPVLRRRDTDCAPTVQLRPRRAMTPSSTTGLVRPEPVLRRRDGWLKLALARRRSTMSQLRRAQFIEDKED
jgi:hypothetical protein